MKKGLVLIAALLIAFSSHARIGIIGGLTSSSSNLKNAYTNVKNVTQYHVGLTYKLGLGSFALQPSLIYNVKGTSLSNATEDIGSFDADFKTGFIELPVQLQAGFSIVEIVRVYGLVEPFIGYAVSNKLSGTWREEYDNTWDFVKSRLEYGIGLGAGVELFNHFQVSLKYYWNFGELYEFDLGDSVEDILTSGANGIKLSVAFLF